MEKEVKCIKDHFDQFKCEQLRGQKAEFNACFVRAIDECPVKVLTVAAQDENKTVCDLMLEADQEGEEFVQHLQELSDKLEKATEALNRLEMDLLANSLGVSTCDLAEAIEKADKH